MQICRVISAVALLALVSPLGGCGSQVYTSEADLVRAEHPSNQWLNRCDNPSYAVCGYDSLRNRQNGGSQAP